MDLTSLLKTLGNLIAAGPQVIQLVTTILSAFQALPASHQTAVTTAVQAHLTKASS